MIPFHGITHLVPPFLLRPWRRLFCRRGWHAFDEVGLIDEHYLSCDACGLAVGIEFIETKWVRP